MPDLPLVTPDEQVLAFGTFRLIPRRQLLLEDGQPVRVGGRAIELLAALVERAGNIVNKEDLVARVWPNVFVEEGNLRVHVAALRRALGDGHGGRRYIATVPGRGYQFVAPVTLVDAAEEPPVAAATPSPFTLARATRIIGRAEVVETLAAQLPHQRFTTIVGPGGIGKTTVALAVAEQLAPSYADGVRFVDLAPIADPGIVPTALASALGVAVHSENPIPGLIAFLKDRRMLVVLDNCEHVIDAAAALTDALFRGASGVHVLATSREPLRVDGERVVRLASLAVPNERTALTASEALSYPAVQLFVERAAAVIDTFEMTDADAPVVADICRRLDGIALAIELAAGRVDAFGVAGLAALLDDRFRVLTRGRRTALPRHQTLAATLDWSYELLPEAERAMLDGLSVFAGEFTLEAAVAVAGSGPDRADAIGTIANLVAKSLVAADLGGPIVHYRLLDTTRAYTLKKLVESGRLRETARRHALYYTNLLEKAETGWASRPDAEWLEDFRHWVDNARTALA